MSKDRKLNKARKFLFVLEYIEAIESSFILGILVYLCNVINLSYMLNILYIIFVISTIFLYSAVKGIFNYYKNYTDVIV